MAKKVIVTGGTGFIGSALIKELLKKNYEIYVFDKNQGNIPNVRYYPLDIRNKEQVQNSIEEIQPDTIIHLAGILKGSYEDLYTTNVIGTKNILDSFNGRLIFMSTGMIYQGNPSPYKEGMPLNPHDDYPKTKKLAEEFCLQKKNTIIIRASVVYGPEQKGSMFIPDLKNKIEKRTTFHMTKGEQKRDFIHVRDLCTAIEILIEKQYTGIINISSGKSIQIKEVIELAKEIIGDFPVEQSLPYREQELWEYCLDNSKAKKELNWEPKINFKEGLKETLLSP